MSSLAPERDELLHDWEQGNYIEGGILEGRIDWDGLEEMENQSLAMLEDWFDRFDNFLVHWSAGIDAAVLLHMLYRLGKTDVPCVSFHTPEVYPSSLEYAEKYPGRLGFDVEMVVDEEHDIDWILKDPKRRVFMPWERKDGLYKAEYHDPVARIHAERDIEMALEGNRQEHNMTPQHVFEKWNTYMGAPIFTWESSHVVAYLDKYSIPIPPMYRSMTTGPYHPWHREETRNALYDHCRTKAECYWYVRQSVVPDGYTQFWEHHICKHFPEAEEMATSFAADTDETLMPVEEGYNHGANIEEIPYPVGPGEY